MDELEEWRHQQAIKDGDIADIIAHYERMKAAPYNSIGGRVLYRRIHEHFPAIIARLKAAEEMREAIAEEVSNAKAGCEYAHQHRGCDAYTNRKMRCPDCPLDAADDLEKAINTYDAATRPISATSEAAATDSAVDGATS